MRGKYKSGAVKVTHGRYCAFYDQSMKFSPVLLNTIKFIFRRGATSDLTSGTRWGQSHSTETAGIGICTIFLVTVYGYLNQIYGTIGHIIYLVTKIRPSGQKVTDQCNRSEYIEKF